MRKDKRSFFEKITGAINMDEDEDYDYEESFNDEDYPRSERRSFSHDSHQAQIIEDRPTFATADLSEGQLSVDVLQTPDDIIIKTVVAGVAPEDLDVSITRDSVTIKGNREQDITVSDNDYFHRELSWGNFTRTISLPAEVEVEEAEAVEKHGVLTIRLPKVDKNRETKLQVRPAGR